MIYFETFQRIIRVARRMHPCRLTTLGWCKFAVRCHTGSWPANGNPWQLRDRRSRWDALSPTPKPVGMLALKLTDANPWQKRTCVQSDNPVPPSLANEYIGGLTSWVMVLHYKSLKSYPQLSTWKALIDAFRSCRMTLYYLWYVLASLLLLRQGDQLEDGNSRSREIVGILEAVYV